MIDLSRPLLLDGGLASALEAMGHDLRDPLWSAKLLLEDPEAIEAAHRAFVDAAVRAGVRHVVYTSFAGASPDATFTLGRDHHDTEQALAKARASEGMTTTVLRDNFYADLLPLFADEVGVLRGPAGSGAVWASALAPTSMVAGAAASADGSRVAVRLVNADGSPAYPNATVEVPQAEADFWLDEATMAKAPEGMQGMFKLAQQAVAPYARMNKLKPYEAQGELLPGVSLVASPGHTPGHMIFFREESKIAQVGDVYLKVLSDEPIFYALTTRY